MKSVKKNIVYSENTNLLEETMFRYKLQNVTEPNLYRELFSYDEVPKISFNRTLVPMNMPSDIYITDTTFRDGQQSTSPYTVEQVVEIYKLLSKLGGKNGIIRQSEFFLYSEKDREAVRKCQELGLEFPEITAWIRASEKDFELVKSMNIAETGILVSCSDYHIFNKMGLTRAQAMDKYLATVKLALEYGVKPRCHFEDITRADFYGFVVPFATELMKLSEEANVPIKIRACDTMGFGVPYHGASMPRSVPGIIYGLRHYTNIPAEQLEWHGHNDFYKVVANASTAWLYGCSTVNCSLLGIGERTGNCPLEAMAIEYASLKGTTNGMDLSVITEIADYFEKEIGYIIPPMTPYVGRYFNSTRAGIHADGMLKDQEIYNIFDTEALLNRPPRIAITNTSGLAGIAYWINDFYELEGDDQILKSENLVALVKDCVDKEYAEGRTSAISDAELDAYIRQIDRKLHKKLEIGMTK